MFLRYTPKGFEPFDLVGLHKESCECFPTLNVVLSHVTKGSVRYFSKSNPGYVALEDSTSLTFPLEFFVLCS